MVVSKINLVIAQLYYMLFPVAMDADELVYKYILDLLPQYWNKDMKLQMKHKQLSKTNRNELKGEWPV